MLLVRMLMVLGIGNVDIDDRENVIIESGTSMRTTSVLVVMTEMRDVDDIQTVESGKVRTKQGIDIMQPPVCAKISLFLCPGPRLLSLVSDYQQQ